MDYDVFNGDADGICALHQLRLAEPRDAELVTGVKRDIALLARVQAGGGDRLTVLDISFDRNRDDVQRLLEAGARIEYYDHHHPGELIEHPNLEAHIDTAADVCTSLIVSHRLRNAYLPWAVVAAFGDNLHDAARKAAEPLGLASEQLIQLEHLGTLINYNGYGISVEDLHFHPADLYREIHPYRDPFEFIQSSSAYRVLAEGHAADMAAARSARVIAETPRTQVLLLPDADWARRVSGVYGNELARAHPDRAHALVLELPDGNYRVSVRAPLSRKEGADELCLRFPTGGGRKAAAGINALPPDLLDAFIESFQVQYGD